MRAHRTRNHRTSVLGPRRGPAGQYQLASASELDGTHDSWCVTRPRLKEFPVRCGIVDRGKLAAVELHGRSSVRIKPPYIAVDAQAFIKAIEEETYRSARCCWQGFGWGFGIRPRRWQARRLSGRANSRGGRSRSATPAFGRSPAIATRHFSNYARITPPRPGTERI